MQYFKVKINVYDEENILIESTQRPTTPCWPLKQENVSSADLHRLSDTPSLPCRGNGLLGRTKVSGH